MKYIGLIIGIALFLFFAWEIEHQHNFFTWVTLLISILNILSFAIEEITDKIKKHIDEKK